MLCLHFHWILLTSFLEVVCFSSSSSILPMRIKVATETTRKVCTTLYEPEDNPSGEIPEDDQCIYCSESNCLPTHEPSQDSMMLHICHVTVTNQEMNFNPGDSLTPCLKDDNEKISGIIKPLLSELQSMITYIQSSFRSLNQTDSKTTEIKYDTDFTTSLRGSNFTDPLNHLPILDLIDSLPLKTLNNNEEDCDLNEITNNVLSTLQHLNEIIYLTTSQHLNDTNPPDSAENIDSTTNEVFQDRETENETNPPDALGNQWNVESTTNEVFLVEEPENETSPDSNITSTSNIMSVLQHLNQIIHDLTDLQHLKGTDSTVPVNKWDIDSIMNELFQHLNRRNETGFNMPEIGAALVSFLPTFTPLNGSVAPALTNFNPIINSIQPILIKLSGIKNDLSILLALNLTGAIIPPHLHFPSILNSIQLALQHLNKIILHLEKSQEPIHKGDVGHPLHDYAPLTASIQAALKILKQILKPSQGPGKAEIKQIDYDLIPDMVKSSMDHFNRIMVELSVLQILNSTGFYNPQIKGVINLIIQDMLPILNLTGPAENIHIDDLIKKAHSFLKKMIIIIDDMQILNVAIKKGTNPSTLIGEMTQLTLQLGVPVYRKPLKFSISLLLPALRKTGSVLINIVETFLQLKNRFIKIEDELLSTVLQMSWNLGSSLTSFLDKTVPMSPLSPITDHIQGLIGKKKDIFQTLMGNQKY